MRKSALWIALGMGAGCGSPGTTPDLPPVALTPTEYNRTVTDLLGFPEDGEQWPAPPPVAMRLSGPQGEDFGGADFVAVDDAPWPWPLPEEVGVDGFEGLAEGQSPSAYQLEQLQKAALHFGAYTLASPTFFTCDSFASLSADAQVSCAESSLVRFAQRAWRRPLTDEEGARLRSLWESLQSSQALDEAIALTAAGILQSPSFLYRIETGEEGAGTVANLTDFELASRLSYFLWDTMPDETLFAAAAEGRLSTAAQIRQQARRMLQDPKARDAVVRFHSQWLETDQVSGVSPARVAFGPTFGLPANTAQDTTDDGAWPVVLGGLRTSFEAETYLFVSKTLFEGAGTLQALLSDNHGYISSATAPLYGDDVVLLSGETIPWDGFYIAGSGANRLSLTLQPATFPPTERAGLLTLPSVLALGAHPVHPSPILRGKRIVERVLCQDIPAPPPGAEAEAPPDTVSASDTNRARTEAVVSPPSCNACHQNFNPLGYGFESYDALGKWRSEDNGEPVDASGELKLRGEVLRFNDGVDLATQLSTHPIVRECYAERWLNYALDTTIDPTDPAAAAMIGKFTRDDDVLQLLEDIAASPLFRTRTRGGE